MLQSTNIMATRRTVASFLVALALMLAIVSTTAAPALAQAGEVSATGTMEWLDAEPVVVDGIQICELSTHSITDEATGQYYDLKSAAVDLDTYVGQRVTVTGTPLASPAIGGAGAERCPDLDVTSIVSADHQGPPPSVEQTDLMAQLTVECPKNAGTLAGYELVTTGVESLTAVPLTDEDGDGVLTGTQTFPRFPPGPLPVPPSVEAQEAFERMSPKEREEFGRLLQEQTRQEGHGGVPGAAAEEDLGNSDFLAQLMSRMHQQQPDAVGSLMKGMLGSGGGGLVGGMLGSGMTGAEEPPEAVA